MVVNESRLFADVMEAIEIAVYVWELEDVDDPAGMRLIYANPTTAVVTGVPTEQLVGRTMRESFPRSDEHARLGVYREVALGGAARDLGDVVYEDARVGRRTFAVRIFPLPNRRVGVACHDVTGQRVAEAGALEVMESMSDAFYSFDREWRYTFINAEGEKVAQRTRDELLGRTIWEVYPAAVGLKLHDAFQRAARSGSRSSPRSTSRCSAPGSRSGCIPRAKASRCTRRTSPPARSSRSRSGSPTRWRPSARSRAAWRTTSTTRSPPSVPRRASRSPSWARALPAPTSSASTTWPAMLPP